MKSVRVAVIAALMSTSAFAVDGPEAAYVASRRQVTLQEALTLTAKNNLDLKAAKAMAAQVAAKSKLATTAALPELSMSLSYVGTTAPAVIDNSGQVELLSTLTRASLLPAAAQQQIVDGLNSAPSTIPIQAAHSLFGNLILTQVLFTPEFILLPAAAEAEQAARLGSLEAREQVLLATARVFLGLEGLEQLEVAAAEAEQVALKREADAKAQVAVGTQTEIAVMRAMSETAQARSVLASLSGNRVALMALLESLAGEPVRPMEATPTHFDVTAQEEAQEPWERLFAIKAASMGLKSQERFNSYDRLTWLPSLVAQAKGNYNSNKGFVNTNWTFDGIVALQWKLYDRGVRYVNMHENDAKTAQQRAQLESSRVRAKANWIGAKANLTMAQVSLQQAEAQAQLAAKAQRQLGSAFQAGLATSLEVSDIDNKKFLASSAVAQSRAQLEIRKVELAATEGRLAEVLGLGEKD